VSRYFIRLAYNGGGYHGWQYQPNAITVQETLEHAISTILRRAIALTGCGRTDRGVHATDFYAHFEFEDFSEPLDCNWLIFKLNNFLDSTIVIFDVFPVSERMHARFSAISRTYEYRITRQKDPFLTQFAWYLFGPIDVTLMNLCASVLAEYEDFTSFSKVDTDTATNLCRIKQAFWSEKGEMLVFTITADRFLRNMVRAIVGTLLDAGKGRINLPEFRTIIETRNRSEAGESVPAHGLFLTRVIYPEGVVPEA